jgi:hypothetical protein
MQLVFAEGAASFAGVLDEYACRAGVGVAEGLGERDRAACNVSGDPTIYTAQTVIAGNSLLQEEEGETFGGGIVFDIMDNMSFSADYYRIKLTDQALQLSSAFLLENEANCRLGEFRDGSPFPNSPDSAFCQNIFNLVTRQGGIPTGTVQRLNSAYINAALTDTSGVDTTWRYTLETESAGLFRFDLAYSIVLTNKYKQFADDELIDYRDDPSSDSRSRARGSITWAKGDWATTVFGTRYGSTTSFAGVAGTNLAGESYGRRLAPYMLYNLQVAKQFGDKVLGTFTVNNVLDNQYRYDASHTAYPFFDTFNGSDPIGRRFNVSVTYRF